MNALSIEKYAAIVAELAEADADRTQVLSTHNLTLSQWRGQANEWSTRLAADVFEGGHELQNRFTEAYVAAQDTLKPVPSFTVEQWAQLECEVNINHAALAARGLSTQDWMRLCRHWARALAADRELARQYASARQKALASSA